MPHKVSEEEALDLLISSGQVFSPDPGMVALTAPSTDTSPMSSLSTMFPTSTSFLVFLLHRPFLPSSFRIPIAPSLSFIPVFRLLLVPSVLVSGIYLRTGPPDFRRLPAYRTPSLPASTRLPDPLSSDIFLPYWTSCLPASTSVTGFSSLHRSTA